jgi:hypothetical protein
VSLELSSSVGFLAAIKGEMEGSPDKVGRLWVATVKRGRSSSSARAAYRWYSGLWGSN